MTVVTGRGIHVLVTPIGAVHGTSVVVVMKVGGLVVTDVVVVVEGLWVVNTFVLVKVGKVLQDTDILVDNWRAFRGDLSNSTVKDGRESPGEGDRKGEREDARGVKGKKAGRTRPF